MNSMNGKKYTITKVITTTIQYTTDTVPADLEASEGSAKAIAASASAPRMAKPTSGIVTIRRPQKDWIRWQAADEKKLKQLHAEYAPRIRNKTKLYKRIGNELGRTAAACAKRYKTLSETQRVRVASAEHTAKPRFWSADEEKALVDKYNLYAPVMKSKSATYKRISEDLHRTQMSVWVKHIDLKNRMPKLDGTHSNTLSQ